MSGLIITSAVAIWGWTIALFVLAIFTGFWAWAYYRQVLRGGDPMAANWLLLHMAYTNMFLCFSVIRLTRTIATGNLDQDLSIMTWGFLSTALVVLAYVLLHYEFKGQQKKAKK